MLKRNNRLIKFGVCSVVLALMSSCSVMKAGGDKTSESVVSVDNDPYVRSLFIEGHKLKSLNDVDGAILVFKTITDSFPTVAAAFYEQAALYDKKSSFIKAIEASKKAVELDQENKWYLTQIAYLYKKNAYKKEALKAYEALHELDPDNQETAMAYVEILANEGKYDLAIKEMDHLEKLLGIPHALGIQKAQLFRQNNKLKESRETLEEYTKANPFDINGLKTLAKDYQQDEMPVKLLETWERILKVDKEDGFTLIQMSKYYANQGDENKALELIVKSFESKTFSIDNKVAILLELYDRGQKNKKILDLGLDLSRKLIELNPLSAKAYAINGDFLMAYQKIDEATESFKNALKLEKSNALIWHQLLVNEVRLQRFDDAYKHAKEAVVLFPSKPTFYLYSGLTANALNEYKESFETLESGVELVFNNPQLKFEFYQNLGEVAHKLKNYKASDTYYKEALKINPNNPYLLNNVAYYLSVREENLEEAAVLAEKANQLLPDKSSLEDTYGWILFRQKKYTQAKEWLKSAIDNGGQNSGVILEHYGDVLFHLNEQKDAVIYWKAAAEKEGTSELLDKKIREEKYYE